LNVLADTSVWSLALRRADSTNIPEAVELRRLIAEHQVEIAGPIRQEILTGLREQAQFDHLEAYLRAYPDLPIVTEDYVAAARFSNLCRTKGVQGSHTDFLICALAARNKLAVFTNDRDFSLFANHLPVTLYKIAKKSGPPA